MAQAGEKYVTQEVWWNPAQAVNFLRDGTTPSATDSWLGLPTAINETRRLNAAIQAGKIDVIELHLDDTQRQLGMEDKACMEIRFHLDAFVGGGVGVTIEVVDTRSDVSRPRIKTLLLRADNVRALLAGPRAAKHLITEEVRRRIAAGERWDSITRFSENLHEWMKTLYGVKPLAARTIANRLRDWKLRPRNRRTHKNAQVCVCWCVMTCAISCPTVRCCAPRRAPCPATTPPLRSRWRASCR